MIELSKKEIGLVVGGSFFKELGKATQEVNQVIDKAIRAAGKELREANDDFQTGKREVRNKDEKDGL